MSGDSNLDAPETAEGTSKPADVVVLAAKRRGPRMDLLAAVRRGLAAVYRETLAWNPADLRPSDRIARARCLGMLLTSIGEVLRSDELERRLAALEDSLRARGH